MRHYYNFTFKGKINLGRWFTLIEKLNSMKVNYICSYGYCPFQMKISFHQDIHSENNASK